MFTKKMRLAAMSTDKAYGEAVRSRDEARETLMSARAKFEEAQSLVNELERKWFNERFAKPVGS